MSIKVMSLVWDNFNKGGSEKLVMLSMADWCNDKGESLHPSHDAIAKKCCISRSQAVRVVRDLVDQGFLEVIGNKFGGAPGTTKQYRVVISALTGSADATPKVETGSTHATGSVDATGSTHASRRVAPSTETGSTHATQTTIEPPIEPPIKNIAPPALLASLGVTDQTAKDFLLIRKAKRAPLTETALNGIRAEASAAGMSLEDALKMCCERGWQSFKADWVKPKNNAPNSHQLNVQEARLDTMNQIFGRAGNGNDGKTIDVTPTGAIEGGRACLPEVSSGVR